MNTISWIFLVIIVFQAAVGIRNTLRIGYYRKIISEMTLKYIEAIAVTEGYHEKLEKYRKENNHGDN